MVRLAGHRDKHFCGVIFWLDFFPHAFDATFRIDEICISLHAHVRLAVHALLHPRLIRVDHARRARFGFVSQQGEVELVFGHEFGVALNVVCAHAQHHRVNAFNSGQIVAEAARLCCAARGVVFGVKVQHDALAAILLERVRVAGLIGE